MSSENPVVDLLADLDAVMRHRDIRWYVFGAQAAIVWGRPRFSADIDVTARIQPASLGPFLESMASQGFELRIRDQEFIERTRVLPFLHHGSGLPLDIVLSGPGIEEDFLVRSISVDLGGLQIPLISPEDLIVTKVLAGRPKDLEDVRGVLRARGATLDMVQIRATLHLLEQALSQSDLLPAFESELNRLPR